MTTDNGIVFAIRRNITVLRTGHVSGLAEPGVGGRESTDTVSDSDVHDPGNAEVVHLEGEGEEVAKGVAVAARQGHGHNRGAYHDRETARRERA